ncbi:MAG: NHL repeat-containing protein, partial [Thermoplasmata archaeon]|nr:NHL repeat-containing protein [Thermoplasmata archaeon]
FAKWRGITSNDFDGDGIMNVDEEKTDEWKWDTDGDGLGDSYELEIGTMPWRYDSDRDGLDDKTEHLWGTDPMVRDSDGDGLNDYIEHNGWVVNFDYFNVTFNWHINSNPLFNNTDGDAVVDYMEYKTLQNPMSRDTNGDGIEDEIKDYFETYFFHDRNVAESYMPRAVAADDQGNVYVAVKKSLDSTPPNTPSLYEDCFVKYDEMGNMLDYYYQLNGPDLYRIEDMKVDLNGYLYIADYERGVVRFNDKHVHDTSFAIPAGQILHPTGVDIDADGNVYISDEASHKIWIVDNTGTVVDSWGGYGNDVDGKFDRPQGVAVHPDGYVYVVDEDNDIEKLHLNGTHIATFSGTAFNSFNNIEDVDVDANGDVFVSDYNAHNIQKMNENG